MTYSGLLPLYFQQNYHLLYKRQFDCLIILFGILPFLVIYCRSFNRLVYLALLLFASFQASNDNTFFHNESLIFYRIKI